MSNQDNLFVEISDEQQEVVAGGAAGLSFENIFNSALVASKKIDRTVAPVGSSTGPDGGKLLSGGVSEKIGVGLEEIKLTGIEFGSISAPAK